MPTVAIVGNDAVLQAAPATPVQLAHACLRRGFTVAVPHVFDTAVLGSAILGAVGIGAHPDVRAGIAAMTRPGAIFTPDPAMKRHYDRRYRLYADLVERLRAFWTALPGGAEDVQ